MRAKKSRFKKELSLLTEKVNQHIKPILLAIGTIFVILLVALMKKDHPEAEPDYLNLIPDEEYQLILDEGEGNSWYALVSGEDLSSSDAARIAQTIKETEAKEGTVYAYSDLPAETHQPTAYEEGLQSASTTTEAGTVQVKTYIKLEDVEADATAIAEWEIDMESAVLNDEEMLEVAVTFPSGEIEKEQLAAQVKGLAEMVARYNPESGYEDILFDIHAGDTEYQYQLGQEDLLVQIESKTVSTDSLIYE